MDIASIIAGFVPIFVLIGISGIKFFKGASTMKRSLSQSNTEQKPCKSAERGQDLEKLVEIQAMALVNIYHTTCFDVKQLQDILGLGESSVYRLLRSGQLPSQKIKGHFIVPVSVLAQFLVMGEKNS